MKKVILLFFLTFSFFVVDRVEAAEILQAEGIGKEVSKPLIYDTTVRFNITSKVPEIKYVRHTKYETSSWNNPVAAKQLGITTRFGAFAYNCPGYYMTRFYSDSEGTHLIGYVRVYVSNTDLKKMNKSCAIIEDDSKALPPDDQSFNVTHPSDYVLEQNKMLGNNVEISTDNPVIRDNVDENFVQYDNEKIDSAVLSAEKACRQQAQNTGIAYQLKYNSNTNSYECVVTSDCLYDTDLWHCNAPTVAQKNASNTTVIDTPKREEYTHTEMECHGGNVASAKCAENIYDDSFSSYKRPIDFLMDDVSVIVTVKPSDSDDGMQSITPSDRQPFYENNGDVVPPPSVGGSCWNPDGTPNFGVEGCFWNCDDSYMKQYSFCSCGGQIEGGPNVQPGQCSVNPDSTENENLGSGENENGDYSENENGDYGENENVGSGGYVEEDLQPEPTCADLICECIVSLSPALSQIDESVKDLYPVLIQIDESVHEVGNQISVAVQDFHNEFETNKDYKINPLPDISGVLDSNRPDESVDRQDTYKNNTTYFTDQGDDTAGDYGKLAPIPEPKHWDGFLPEEAMPAEKELKKDGELKRSAENKIDAILKQSPEMKLDTIQQSPEMQQEYLNQNEFYNRNHFYNQTNTNLGGD